MNSDSPNRIRSFKIDTRDPGMNDCARAWMEAQQGSDRVPGCRHYFNPSLCNPSWARGAEIVAEIGNHRFVKVK